MCKKPARAGLLYVAVRKAAAALHLRYITLVPLRYCEMEHELLRILGEGGNHDESVVQTGSLDSAFRRRYGVCEYG